jgi:hypothetical protein
VDRGDIRDVVIPKSSDHGATWSAPVKVAFDDWRVDACPHAGPAIAVDDSNVVHVAWWTGVPGSPGVRYARSINGGKTFSLPTYLDVAAFSRPAHVQLALARGGHVFVVWDQGTTAVPRIAIAMSADAGRHFRPALVLSETGRVASFPVIGVTGDSIAVAWSEESTASAKAQAAAQPDMRDPSSKMGLHPVGDAVVMLRRGVFR